MPIVSLPPVAAAALAAVCLAQAEPVPEQPAAPLPFQLFPLVAIGVLAYLLLFRPERERIRKQQSMQAGLKKNDRVVTASGLYGTVVAVDRDRVTLRIDDSANVKDTVTLASIGRVLGDGGEPSATEP
jgi:preprotein translocase subunit YajC